MYRHWNKVTCDEKYFADRHGDTDDEVFPLGIETIDADELVSDWFIGLNEVPWFNSATEKKRLQIELL